MDPEQKPRNGGGEQVITDGGYRSGAVINKDAKYPIPKENKSLSRENSHSGENKSHKKKATNAPANKKGISM